MAFLSLFGAPSAQRGSLLLPCFLYISSAKSCSSCLYTVCVCLKHCKNTFCLMTFKKKMQMCPKPKKGNSTYTSSPPPAQLPRSQLCMSDKPGLVSSSPPFPRHRLNHSNGFPSVLLSFPFHSASAMPESLPHTKSYPDP